MADKPEHQKQDDAGKPDDAAPAMAGGEAEADDDAGVSGFANPLEFLRAELERVEAEKAEAGDRAVRLVAEMENLRKRTARDVVDARQYSIAAFAREMLAVSDNLRRAMDAVPAETRQSGDAGLAALIEGVELTERSMLQALEKHGVKRISPIGERFDPNFHQAMFEIQDPETPSNTVLQVVQDGYVIGDRVLRPALVGVSRGGPKLAAKAEEEAAGGQ